MEIKEWLGEDNKLGIDILTNKYLQEGETLEEWFDRVSGGDEELRQLIKDKKFLFGGRVLANRGVEGTGNYYNCFSAGYVKDDYSSILDMAKEIGVTFKSQGGQGISLSKLRPKGTPIGDKYESDGIIGFMELFNCVTEQTSQGGARKGALMMSLDARHKEAESFITIKSNEDRITKANLSLEIDDEFMKAVRKYYDDGEVVVLHEVRDYSGHIVEYDVTPINLYKKVMEIAHEWGEPGVLFTNRARNYNFLEYDDEYVVATTNPCGEQTLAEKFSCNLGSLNLYEFVENKFTDKARVDWDGLADAVKTAIRGLDKVIDENMDRLPNSLYEYKTNAYNWRNVGLGVFGYAYMLIALGLKYGSTEALEFTDKLFDSIMQVAIDYDEVLGMELGSYPKFKANKVTKSSIYKHHRLDWDRPIYYMRNCSLLSIAPTGSISTMMLGGSGGVEPEFQFSYIRRTDNLDESYTIESKIVKDYREVTHNYGELPDYFVASSDIKWKDRVDTQAIIQNHVDTAISSTVNLPKETTREEIEQLYLYAWEQGLKGVTIFRDGCKRLGILLTDTADTESDAKLPTGFNRGDIISVSDDLIGYKRKVINGCGDFQLQLFFDDVTGEPLESYISIGDGGGCAKNLEAISRLVSLCFRAGVDVSEVIKQLKKVRPCVSYVNRARTKGDTSRGTSCPNAIGNALEELCDKICDRCFSDEDCFSNEIYGERVVRAENTVTEQLIQTDTEGRCPDCGEPLAHEGGCDVCRNCGFSHCG